MNHELTTSSPVLIQDPTDTINLRNYYLSGSRFNWKNIAITLNEWPLPTYGNVEQHACIACGTHDIFVITYKTVDLGFELANPATVFWGHTEWLPEDGGFAITTFPIVPTDPVELLHFLNLADHPDAGDITEFWANLLKLFTFIRVFQEN
jgi:hypothetical protein